MDQSTPFIRCIECGRPPAVGGPAPALCPYCALPLTGPVPGRVRAIDAEVSWLERRVTALLSQRAALIAGLRATTQAPVYAPGPVYAPPPVAEASAPAARNVLLVLGGVLLTVAALAFALLSWGHLGIGGRAGVIGALTLTALALPVPLLRRSLNATGEAVAGIGLVLLLLDAYLLHRVALPDADPVGYTAVSAAVVAGLWAGYGWRLPGLRAPLPTALGIAQLAPVLCALAMDVGEYGLAWVLLGTATADVATAVARRGARPVRRVAAVSAVLTGGPALLLALWQLDAADGGGAAVRASALLAAGGVVLLAAGRRRPALTERLDVVAGLLLIAAAGGAVRPAMPGTGWEVLGVLLAAVALLAGALAARARGLATAAGVVHAGALLWALPAVREAVLEPLGWAARVGEGAPGGAAREAVGPGVAWSGDGSTPVVLGVVAAVLAAVGRLPAPEVVPAERRSELAGGAVVLGAMAALAGVLALGLPYAATLALLVALVLALLARAALAGDAPAGAAALALAGTSVGWALAEREATQVVLAVLGAAFAGAAWRAAPAAHRAVSAAAALGCAAGLARAVPAAWGWPAEGAAFVLLAVALAGAALAARLRARPLVSRALEGTGYAVALAALVCAGGSPAALALALTVCAIGAGGVALRDDRRAAAYAVPVLLVAALWVRLSAWQVTVPEAYTAPVAVAALVIGALRRRAAAGVPSWQAYGPGLAVSFGPSLLALWGDPHWVRPLLLGTWALAVTLVGARLRLRAPLLWGGGALALVAANELAPYVVQVAGLAPRWLPPALAGLLLLVVGATYERRLAEARRVRAAWRRLA
ncbi:SCO7613 C-terminal domain-containing membrane protein [Streptomyces litchfieldiae]|uniref:Integral membrane protein n=1 Tax=Streptomyces litchfieldiae TaxID=3075543 RepID=A0ABU2MKG8_9ACTN|nr:hypothetical protein [Streptomyces sp. DSM 44938]MDT0341971.1 hypothetical protein [Streptomyces sp. DSM 44938]